VGLEDDVEEEMGKKQIYLFLCLAGWQVGISSVWYEGNTCNMHLLKLSEAVKEGVRDAGMVGFRFNTVGVSDAISMGTEGMCYSLQSRDLIADSIETVMGGQWYDANISIPGCDKNVSDWCTSPLLFAIGKFSEFGITTEQHYYYWQLQTLDP
jgi:dihydroxyacid dehydratase/phosphogluconate dehydratase